MKVKKDRKKKVENFENDLDIETAKNMLMTLPIPGIIASIEMQINILKRRGVVIKDWDNKNRTVEQIRMIGGKVYFLAIDDNTKE
jgi:hypothetical protein